MLTAPLARATVLDTASFSPMRTRSKPTARSSRRGREAKLASRSTATGPCHMMTARKVSSIAPASCGSIRASACRPDAKASRAYVLRADSPFPSFSDIEAAQHALDVAIGELGCRNMFMLHVSDA